MLNTSDFNSIISDYTGRHLIYTITPYAVSGKKGVTVYSDPVFLHGPTVTNGLVMHLDASMVSKDPAVSSIETSGDTIYVTQWDDLSGQNNHAYQGTTSIKPKLTEIQYKDDLYVWGKTLQPNNAGTSMNIGSFNPSSFNDFTVFVVAKSNASHTNTPIVNGGSGSWSFGWNEGGWLAFNAGGDPAILEGGQGLDNKLHVFSMVASGGTASIRINGVSGAASGTASPVSTTPLSINWNQMDIAEILIYNRNLSTSNDLLDVETYLMNKYDPDPADVLSYIVYLKPLPSRTIVQGDSFSPPGTVEALMSNGISQHVAVTWTGSIDTSTIGSQSITATAVMDSTKTTNLTVNVVGIESLLPHTTDDIVLELGTPDNMPSRLEAILTDGSKRLVDVIWSSNTEDISVSETIVTGNDLGVYPNGLTATAVLNPAVSIDYGVEVVGVLVTGVTVEPVSLVMNIDDTSQLTATVLPNDASNKNVDWSSSDETVATVDENGLVTAISDGEATITVTTEDGDFEATSNVEVLAEPVEVVGYEARNVNSYTRWWGSYISADIYILLSDETEYFHGNEEETFYFSYDPSINRNITGTATADSTGESVPYSLTINVNP